MPKNSIQFNNNFFKLILYTDVLNKKTAFISINIVYNYCNIQNYSHSIVAGGFELIS